jgi:uncharacterized protein YndB with AHSA1/START domain/DNA-binding transcriptional ArsR family regulator
VDAVFKALADPTRRELLDRLRERNGQTLGELCDGIAMARQSTTQHLDVLAAANLVSAVRSGRQKLHYLNPVPLHEIQERWIDNFEAPRLRAIGAIRRRAEAAMTDTPDFVYVTYIESTPERVWDALTDPELTAQYWGHSNVSPDWRPGSRWDHVRTDGSGESDGGGEVVVSDRPRALVLTWEGSTVAFDIEPYGDIVRLTVEHRDLGSEEERAGAASGWAAVLSNLKSLLETGRPLPQAPWEMTQRR